ncbi:MAG TPA: hypothetical protein VGH63_14265, partial [Polyangia bacterium]
MDAIIHESDGGLALASCGAVYISILRRPLTLDGVARMTRHSKRLYELHRGRSASFLAAEAT